MAKLSNRPEKVWGVKKSKPKGTASLFVYGIVKHVMRAKTVTTNGDFMYVSDGVHWLKTSRSMLNFQFDAKVVYGDGMEEMVRLEKYFSESMKETRRHSALSSLFTVNNIITGRTEKDHNEFVIGVLPSEKLVGLHADIIKTVSGVVSPHFFAIRDRGGRDGLEKVVACAEIVLDGETLQIVTMAVDTKSLKARFDRLLGKRDFL